MAKFFVFNRTNPAASAHRAGTVIETAATDVVTAVSNAYNELHPLADGDQLEIIPATSVVYVAADASFDYGSGTEPTLPDPGE